jgi:L-iditol 2-dehydrogenase
MIAAARLHGVGDLRVVPEPAPVAGSGLSLVRPTAVGLCGSDLHWFTDGGIGDAALSRPLVLGHEIAGIVEEGPMAGRHVAVDPSWPCGRCEHCLAGNRNLCAAVRFAGHGGNDGGLRELMAWPDDLLHPLPDSVDDAQGAMLEPLGVALHAMDLGRPRLGETVAVVGCGPIGLCAVQLARAAGADRVIAIEPLQHRRDAATRLGADVVLDPGAVSPEALLDATAGRGAGLVLEVAGNDAAVDTSLEVARAGGVVVLVGIPDRDSTTFRASVARRKGLTLKLTRRMKEMYPRTIGLVERGVVDVASIVSHTYPLDHVTEAFVTAQERRGLKVIVTPWAPGTSDGTDR